MHCDDIKDGRCRIFTDDLRRIAACPGWKLHVDRRRRSVNVSMAKGQGRLDDREPSGSTRINTMGGICFGLKYPTRIN
jgi:hypothetical protein